VVTTTVRIARFKQITYSPAQLPTQRPFARNGRQSDLPTSGAPISRPADGLTKGRGWDASDLW
jgi:hypothetical protein